MNRRIFIIFTIFMVLLTVWGVFSVGCSNPEDSNDNENNNPDTLTVPDTTQPDSTGIGTITSINSISIGNSPVYVQKYEDLLIVATFMGGYYIKIFSITDPANPEQISSINVGNIVNAMDVCDDRIFVSIGNNVKVIDISDPSSPSFVGEIFLVEQGIGIAAGDDNLFVGYMASGSSIYDVSDLDDIQLIGSITTSFKSGDYFYGKFVCSPANSGNLYYYDVSDPANPQNIGSGNSGGQNNDIAITPWGFIYIAAGTQTATNNAVFSAVDVHNISETPFQDIIVNQDCRRVAFQHNFAYAVFHDDFSNNDVMLAYFTYRLESAYSFFQQSYSNIQDIDAGDGYIYIASMDDGGTMYILRHEF